MIHGDSRISRIIPRSVRRVGRGAMFGNRGGDKVELIWRSRGCGWRKNPGDMWVNRYAAAFVHVIPGLLAVACPADNAMLAGSVCGEQITGVDRDPMVMHALAFSMHEGPG